MERRPYRSAKRQAQAAATRESIVDEAAALLASRAPDISMPEVASAAAVSVATVYRYFATKDDLLEAVYERWMAKAREALPPPGGGGLDPLLDSLAEFWRLLGEDAELERALSLSSPAGRRVRARRASRRKQAVVSALADITEGLPSDEAFRIHAVVHLLTSTAARTHWRDYWAADDDQAAQLARWAVDRLLDREPCRR